MILNHGNNETEIIYNEFHLLYSYTTPVAAFHPDSDTVYITKKKYSRTTTAHIKKWIVYLEDKAGRLFHDQLIDSEILLYLSEKTNHGKTFKEIVDPKPKPPTLKEIRMSRFDNLGQDS